MGQPDHDMRDAIVAHLRRHHPDMCRHWFDDIEPLEVSGGTIKLLIHEPVQLNYLRKRCVEPFQEAVQAVTGHLLAVRFVGPDDVEAEPAEPTRSSSFNGARGGSSSSDENPIYEQMLISPDYSFENFVVGPANRLAHAAALAVAQQPGRAYNPFFIHGGVGLGKTHLLQAICQRVLRANPATRIHYDSCDQFMNQFMDAVQAGRMNDFRHRFRNVDMLIIDDIHDLAQRERTQEEFFHTFNSLYQAGKQIVLSSDAPPDEIPDLEERLTSRFNSGLVARIDKPCYETRVAIVKSKAALRSLTLPDELVSYIAAKIDSNIRALEGAISRLQVLSMVNESSAIDHDMAKEAVRELAGGSGGVQPSQPTIQDIIEAVTGYYDVKLTDLLSKRRQKSIALPRQICMWLARKHTRFSLEEIGGYFGGRDHTTVMHAVKTIDGRRNENETLEHDVSRLEEMLLAKHDQQREQPA